MLGPLGGAFRGTVIDFIPGREFFVADAYWLPAEGAKDAWQITAWRGEQWNVARE